MRINDQERIQEYQNSIYLNNAPVSVVQSV